MRRTRKPYTAQEKVAILRKHLLEKIPVSELCDEYGLQPTVFYRWQKQLFEQAAETGFQRSRGSGSARMKRQVSELEAKLATKDEVLGEVMEEYVGLKKSLGQFEWHVGMPGNAGPGSRSGQRVVRESRYWHRSFDHLAGHQQEQVL